MLACVDVHYSGNHATAACILFDDWTDSSPVAQTRTTLSEIEPYLPGRFYLRELPCILKVLNLVSEKPDIILIDGYVWLGDHESPGLGAYLYDELGRSAPVIGIAKNKYRQSDYAIRVIRGNSKKPLFVTAAGMKQEKAAEYVAGMHGIFRIPTLLRKVDQLSRVDIS